jgi:hypothetical protein
MKLSHLKTRPGPQVAFPAMGTVVKAEPELVVKTEMGLLHARRALSCLLQCEPGDLVLVCVTGGDDAYVLAVLERDQSSAATLTFPGDLEVSLPGGALRLNGSQGIALTSATDIGVVAPRVTVGAIKAEVTAGELSYFGTRVNAHLETINLAARVINSTLGTLYERISRVFRKVEEIEQVQAGQIDLQARDSLSMHGRHTLMTADQLVKVDGAQIHLG